jgi:hypothetical protein
MSASLNQPFATPIPTTRPAWFLEEIDVALSIFQATCAIQASEGQIVDAQGMLDHVQIPGIKSAWRVYIGLLGICFRPTHSYSSV